MKYQDAQGLEFSFNFADEVLQEVRVGIESAGEAWSQFITDDVSLKINVGFEPASDPNEGANADSSLVEVAYSDYRQALVENATSEDDAITIANLPDGESIDLLINNTQENQGNDAAYLDDNDSNNNSTIELTTANAKALGLDVEDSIDDIVEDTQIDTTQTFSLPEPTGDYAVGTTSYHFIDSGREETYTADPNDNREITAKVWYPSVELPEADTSPYLSEELSNAIALGLDIPPADFINVIDSISTNSIANAPIAETESEFPVLIFSHGSGTLPELNTVTAEELASQGYVVVSLNHTYDSLVNVFPDGRVIPQSSIFSGAESVDIRAEDARFVLDEFEEINAGDDPTGLFSGKLDLERVGMYGTSWGGATAAKVLSVDSRFEAGINLDGPLLGDIPNASLSQPFMFVNNEALGTEDSIFNQIQQSFVENLQNEGYEATIKGTEHANFSDSSLIIPILLNSGLESEALAALLGPDIEDNLGTIDPQLALEITRDYTVAFFEQYLNNQESPLLQGNSSPYPEVMFQSYNLNPFEPNFGTVNGDVLEIDSAKELIFAGSDNDLINSDAKALDLDMEDSIDGTITFNSDVNWDFDRSDGIAENAIDFESVAIHEIGHILGFTSGIEDLDEVASENLAELITSEEINLEDVVEVLGLEDLVIEFGLEAAIEDVDLGEIIAGSPIEPLLESIDVDLFVSEDEYTPNSMDLFRYSESSSDLGIIDFTTGEAEKYFSIDRGQTEIAQFTTGALGDGGEISHWQSGQGIGIMQPGIGSGAIVNISDTDLQLLDVIGWEIA